MEGVVEVGYLYEQFRKVLADHGTHRLFAKPVKALDDEGREAYQWMTDVPGNAVSFTGLDEETQEALLRRIQVEIRELEERVRADETLHPGDRNNLLSALDKAFEIPDISALYQIGDRPVLTQWGHLLPSWDAPQGILRRLIAERVDEVEPACVWIRTVELDGTPTAGVAVAARDEQGGILGSGVSDPSGMVKITDLNPGQNVEIGVAPEMDDVEATRKTVEAGASAESATVILALQRQRSVNLRVLDSGEGQPWTGTEIGVDCGGEEMASGQTDGNGAFALDHVPINAEQLSIRITLPDGSSHREEVALTAGVDEYTLYVKPKRDLKRPLMYAGVSLAGLAVVAVLLWAVCLFPGGPGWCQPPELVRTVASKAELVELPAGAQSVRIEVYVAPGEPGLQLFTEDGEHLAGRAFAEVGLDELSETARAELTGVVHAASSAIAERYDASVINEGAGHDHGDLNWTEYEGIEIGFSGPVDGDEGTEVLEIREVTDQDLVVLAAEGAAAMVSLQEAD